MSRIRILACLVLFSVLWIFAVAKMAPIPDEAYYWTWSQSLASRYFDHPPGIAWLVAFSTNIFGDGFFGLRFFSVLSIAVTLLFSVLSVRRLLGEERAERRAEADELVVLVLLGAPMFSIGYLAITPDPIHGALTAMAAYASIRALEDQSRGWWSSLAAFLFVLAIGLKHYAAFIAFGALIGVFSVRSGRNRLLSAWPWLGVGLGLVVLSPWLLAESQVVESSALWQYRRALYGRANRGWTSSYLMLGSLMGTLGPVTALLLIFVLVRARVLLVLSLGSAALLLACFLAVWAGSGEANWPMPALVFAVPLLTLRLLESHRWARVFRWSAWLMVLVNALFLLHASTRILPVERFHDPTNRGIGFDRISNAAVEMAEHHQARVLVTERYQIASLLRYHLKDQFLVHEIATPRARKSQFDLWVRPSVCAGDTVIWVSPEASLPQWVKALDLSTKSTRRMVKRGVQGRKVENVWYVTAALARSNKGRLDLRCGSGGSS